MTKFSVNVGDKDDVPKSPKKPGEKRSIHPGLEQIATAYRCLKCDYIFDMEPTCQSIPMASMCYRIGWCECGLWLQRRYADPLRWVRFACGPVLPNSGPITVDGTEQFAKKTNHEE